MLHTVSAMLCPCSATRHYSSSRDLPLTENCSCLSLQSFVKGASVSPSKQNGLRGNVFESRSSRSCQCSFCCSARPHSLVTTPHVASCTSYFLRVIADGVEFGMNSCVIDNVLSLVNYYSKRDMDVGVPAAHPFGKELNVPLTFHALRVLQLRKQNVSILLHVEEWLLLPIIGQSTCFHGNAMNVPWETLPAMPFK